MGQKHSNEISGQVSVNVATQKSVYVAGETIRGYVQLVVHKEQQDLEVSCELLAVARTTVRYTTGGSKHRHTHTAIENNPVLKQDAPVLARTNLRPGNYQLNFVFTLPMNAPSTIPGFKSGRNSDSLFYNIGVAIRRHGWFKRNLVHRVALSVIAAPPAQIIQPASMSKPIGIYSCCFSSGVITLSAQPDLSAYKGGDAITLSFFVDSTTSGQTPSRIELMLIERHRISARGHSTVFEKILHSTFGDIDNPNPQKVRLLVPRSPLFSSTCVSRTMSVTHFVRIYAPTPGCCVTDPVLEVPVQLYLSAPAGIATAQGIVVAPNPATASDSLPIATAIPYNPTNASAPVAKGMPLDTTGDGIADAWGYDTTGDGKIDALDTTRDGKIDTFNISIAAKEEK